MTRGIVAPMLVLIAACVGACAGGPGDDGGTTGAPVLTRSAAADAQGFLYGRVTTGDGDLYQGRLRFGGDEEALWSSYFNGQKDRNPWIAYAPLDGLPRERLSWQLFGMEVVLKLRPEARRPFMARFGDIARIEARGRDLEVTLRSGTVVHLDRYAADDFADGVRVWHRDGVVDLGEREIRSIEFLSTASPGTAPEALYGTVRTGHGDFTGHLEWDREAFVGSDELRGQGVDGEVSLRFDAIRSISRRAHDGALVTLRDGRRTMLAHTRRDGRENRGIYVDDPRYGRVLIPWDAFERLDLTPGRAAPAYHDFRPGQPLTGTVVTRFGRSLTGRLVYDLDESETTETLDAPSHGVDYTIPFELIAAVEPLPEGSDHGSRVILLNGEALQLEPTGDLSDWNAGILIFPGKSQGPEYVAWRDVERIVFHPAAARSVPGQPLISR